MGTWSGVASAIRPYGDLGLIWVDAHMDAHTPSSSPSGNIHGMPVAHLLGYGDKNLIRIGDRLPKILPHNMCMVGIRSYENGEQELLERLGVRIFYMDEVERRGIAEVMHEALYMVTRNTVGFGMSIDIDGFDVADAPAVGTPAENGIAASEFLRAVLTLDLSKLLATEIVEFLPKLDDPHKSSERLVVNLMESIYLTKFFQHETTAAIEQRMQANA
ncbi:arginase domain protein [Teladorsagia circumcincta]|uniref:Arginase n=1 Tax=Teladorsagia circumcincta TaxID=45464 RepID=A0A2G9UBF5_TELCI|nr:arginase domain protein [Teladorsagia circumcincta]